MLIRKILHNQFYFWFVLLSLIYQQDFFLLHRKMFNHHEFKETSNLCNSGASVWKQHQFYPGKTYYGGQQAPVVATLIGLLST